MAVTTSTVRLTSESKTFVTFVSRYFGVKWVKSLNARQDASRITYILNEVVRLANSGIYEEVSRSFDAPAYALGWVIETGRINGTTHMALRQMDVRAILTLVATIRQLGLGQAEVAAYLMSLNLQPNGGNH